MRGWTLTPTSTDAGRRAERLAADFLRAKGYAIERANFRAPPGEIDLIAWEGRVLCFIEVRARRSARWGGPLDTVGGVKQRRLARAAQWYLARRGGPPPLCRFDVVSVLAPVHGPGTIELIRGAFEAGR